MYKDEISDDDDEMMAPRFQKEKPPHLATLFGQGFIDFSPVHHTSCSLEPAL